MKNLIIGNSQQSYYYPEDYIRISSRNIDFQYLKNNEWDSVYITFAEQRVHDSNIDYFSINYVYTLEVIESLLNSSNRIIVFTSCELWNNYVGQVDITQPFSYKSNDSYLLSKERLYYEINDRKKNQELYNKIIVIHPFYFNSIHRSEYFLFGKIFNSILNKKQIHIGNTYFYRDMVHAKYLVERVMNAKSDEIVGSGRLFHINDFIRDLYDYFQMDYNQYIIEDVNIKNNHSEKLYYSYQTNIYTYDMLLNDTIADIKNKMII